MPSLIMTRLCQEMSGHVRSCQDRSDEGEIRSGQENVSTSQF